MIDIKKQAPVLYELASHIAGVQNIMLPEQTRDQVKRVLLDTIGVGLYGSAFCKTVTWSLMKEYAPGACYVWGEKHTGAIAATFFNALAVSSMDFDEGHEKSRGHSAGLVVPAALAVGRESGANFEELLTAITVGYEIGTRFSAARDLTHVKTFSTGCWGALASTATAAILLHLNEEQTMHALSLSALLSPVMMGGYIDVGSGSMAKEGVAWAARIGVESAYLAKKGFTGPYLFLDEEGKYDKGTLLTDFGGIWYIDSNYFKPYACCRWIHPAIDAALDLKRRHNISFAQIKDVEIESFSRIINLTQTREQLNSQQAQFNLPFCIATALFYDALLPDSIAGKNLHNEQVTSLASAISMTVKKDYDDMFPERIPSRVTIKTSDETFVSSVYDSSRWGSDNPATDDDLHEKFRHLTGNRGDDIWCSVMQDEVKNSEEVDRLIAQYFAKD